MYESVFFFPQKLNSKSILVSQIPEITKNFFRKKDQCNQFFLSEPSDYLN